MNTLCIIYKAKHNMLPDNIMNIFGNCEIIHKYNTRSSSRGNFAVQYCRTKSRSMVTSIKGIKLCKNCKLLSNFKHSVKLGYLRYYNLNVNAGL